MPQKLLSRRKRPRSRLSLVKDRLALGAHAPPAHYSDLFAAEDEAWARLSNGATSRHSPFHQAAVATVGEDGSPAARTVVLRAADRLTLRLRFHTDARSPKFASLAQDPRCTVLCYDHDDKIQVRAAGAAILHHQDAFADGIWQKMMDFSKDCYRQPVAPGVPLERGNGAEGPLLSEDGGFGNFVCVEVMVATIEWLYLAAGGHRRALFEYGDRVERVWLAP